MDKNFFLLGIRPLFINKKFFFHLHLLLKNVKNITLIFIEIYIFYRKQRNKIRL